MKWLLIGIADGTYIWKLDNDIPVYRTTPTNKPPAGIGGYFSLMALLRISGLTHKPVLPTDKQL